MIDLGGIPGGGSTYATAVNAQGQVVGYGFPLHQPAPRSPYAERALLWTVADTTPPLITPDVQGMLGQNGWYRSDVTVTWDLTDPESAITSSSGCGATTITTDTQGTTITCTATSLGGTSSRSVTIRRDATPPTITCAPSPHTLWPPNQKLIPVTTTITVSDSGSGPDGFLLTSLGVNEGDLASDMQGWTVATPDMSGLLRAARFGSGSGRIYALDYEGKDAAGNTATCSATVTVPHDNGRP
jgi:hypothetical protein